MLTQKQRNNFLICHSYYRFTDFEISIQQGDINLFLNYLNEIPNIDFNRLTSTNDSLINLSLKKASLQKDYTIPQSILNHHSFDINKEQKDPLLTACELNDFNIFKILLKKGFKLDNIEIYINTTLSKGIISDNIDKKTLDLSFYLIQNINQFSKESLSLFYVLFFKQYIKRSKSLHSKEDIVLFEDKSDALFINICDKNGYNKDTLLKEDGHDKNIIYYLVKYKEYKLLSYILKSNQEDIYYFKNEDLFPLCIAIKQMDIELFQWLLNNTHITEIKNDNSILPLSYIINLIEDNYDKRQIKNIYIKRNNIFETMFTQLIDLGFSCHSTFRDFSSAYALLLSSENIEKDLRFKLLDRIKQSKDFNINLIDSNKETIFSIIYTVNEYDDIFKWLLNNGAKANYNNKSSLSMIISRQFDLKRITSILDIDNKKDYYKINKETVYHTLILSKHNDEIKYNLLNLLYDYGYDILSPNQDNINCLMLSKDKIYNDNFIRCISSFYQNELLKSKMKEKMSEKYTHTFIAKRI